VQRLLRLLSHPVEPLLQGLGVADHELGRSLLKTLVSVLEPLELDRRLLLDDLRLLNRALDGFKVRPDHAQLTLHVVWFGLDRWQTQLSLALFRGPISVVPIYSLDPKGQFSRVQLVLLKRAHLMDALIL
jgi:hypothetical protein